MSSSRILSFRESDSVTNVIGLNLKGRVRQTCPGTTDRRTSDFGILMVVIDYTQRVTAQLYQTPCPHGSTGEVGPSPYYLRWAYTLEPSSSNIRFSCSSYAPSYYPGSSEP